MENKDLNFEDAMNKLELIANELEKNELTLDQAVLKFEQGMKISKQCSEILEDAEKRISVLVKKDDEYTEEKFSI